MSFPSQKFFNDINHGCKAALLKKKPLWLLSFYMDVASYYYYEKVRRTMRALQLYRTYLDIFILFQLRS